MDASFHRFSLLSLLGFALILSGCQSIGSGTQDDRFANFRCVYYGDQDPITWEQIEYIRKRSENGDLLCKIVLGDLYEHGHGVPQDIPKAKTLYQSVADVEVSANYQLGRMEEEGIGGPSNYVKARQFYQRAAAKSESTRSKIQLAGLMEDGKGGPQDLEGALALYFNAIKYIGDDAWKGVQRLRAKGLALNAEQEKRYNEIWASSVRDRLGRKITDAQIKLSKEFKPAPAIKPVKLQLEYAPGSVIPLISPLESSGDSAIDQAVLQAMSNYRFPDEPILHEGEKTWKVIAIVNLGSE
jgi:uncharacterized protein